MTAPRQCGTLYCVATPIGNLDDMSFRAVETLKKVTTIACEDTRSARRLLSRFSIPAPRLVSFYEHNEQARTDQLIAFLKQGNDVALISEAGTPTVSDPGYRLVKKCTEEGVAVVPIPGPCAAIAALSASGLPSDRFLFLGFPPKKGAKLKSFVDQAIDSQRTSIVYLPARRLPEFLELLVGAAPNSKVVMARELTKSYEQFLRGSPSQLIEELGLRTFFVKGEVTLVIYNPDVDQKSA